MMQSSLVEKLRILRAQRGLTVRDAAQQIGVDRHTLHRLEGGVGEPRYPTLHKIAKGYGVPIEELLAEEEPALAGKAEAPEEGPGRTPSAPDSIEALLEREGIEAPHLMMPAEEFDRLYEGLSFEEALDLNREVLDEERAVRGVLDRLSLPPKNTRAYSDFVGLHFTLLQLGIAAAANLDQVIKTDTQKRQAAEVQRALRGAA